MNASCSADNVPEPDADKDLWRTGGLELSQECVEFPSPQTCCPAAEVFLAGTPAADSLSAPLYQSSCVVAKAGADWVGGSHEGDVIFGGAGADDVQAGPGSDLVFGGRGGDWLDAGAGHDEVSGGRGPDMVWGGPGSDTIRGGRGGDALKGGKGDDRLEGSYGADVLKGGDGDDVLVPGGGRDESFGGPGDDRFVLHAQCEVEPGEVIKGGPGHDVVDSPFTREELERQGVVFTSIEEFTRIEAEGLLATCAEPGGCDCSLGNPRFCDDGANTCVILGGEDATVHGGAGDDALLGGDGDEVLIPGPGRDSVNAGDGNDVVEIQSFCDLARGERLDGGRGVDTLRTPVSEPELKALGVIVRGFENIELVPESDPSCSASTPVWSEAMGIEYRATTRREQAINGWAPGSWLVELGQPASPGGSELSVHVVNQAGALQEIRLPLDGRRSDRTFGKLGYGDGAPPARYTNPLVERFASPDGVILIAPELFPPLTTAPRNVFFGWLDFDQARHSFGVLEGNAFTESLPLSSIEIAVLGGLPPQPGVDDTYQLPPEFETRAVGFVGSPDFCQDSYPQGWFVRMLAQEESNNAVATRYNIDFGGNPLRMDLAVGVCHFLFGEFDQEDIPRDHYECSKREEVWQYEDLELELCLDADGHEYPWSESIPLHSMNGNPLTGHQGIGLYERLPVEVWDHAKLHLPLQDLNIIQHFQNSQFQCTSGTVAQGCARIGSAIPKSVVQVDHWPAGGSMHEISHGLLPSMTDHHAFAEPVMPLFGCTSSGSLMSAGAGACDSIEYSSVNGTEMFNCIQNIGWTDGECPRGRGILEGNLP